MKIVRGILLTAIAVGLWGAAPAEAKHRRHHHRIELVTGTASMTLEKKAEAPRRTWSRKAIKRAKAKRAARAKAAQLASLRKTANFRADPAKPKIVMIRDCPVDALRIDGLTRIAGWSLDQLLKPYIRPIRMTEPLAPWQEALIDEREDTIQYLMRTATPGGTMERQGVRLSIERLHPVFAWRLSKAIREARANGLPSAGIYSAYRPAGFGVGGFKDKFRSNHNIGQAVDMAGIGRPGSKETLIWYRVAGRNKLFNPYGPYHRAEWNHYQPSMMLAVAGGSAIRKTVNRDGPIVTKELTLFRIAGAYVPVMSGLARMWSVGDDLIRNTAYLGQPPESRRRHARRHTGHRYALRHKRVKYAVAS